MKKKSIFFMFLTFFCTNKAKTVFITVHGTWGASESWYVPGGDFFDSLENSAQCYDGTVVPFRWSGKNHPDERKKAAHHLAKLIQTYDETNTSIVLITHSHGGNVGILASQILHTYPENSQKIHLFYAIATPVNADIYPNMDIINYFYNFFSLEDMIQSVCGMFEREYRCHERIANIRIFFDNKQLGHTDLHHPYLAHWLPQLHAHFISEKCIKNLDAFSSPGLLYFTKDELPQYATDLNRNELIERDKRFSMLMIHSMKHKKYTNFHPYVIL